MQLMEKIESLGKVLHLAVWILVALALGSCSEHGLIVDIGTWPEGADHLRVKTTFLAMPGREQTVPNGATRFVIWVPPGAQGQLALEITALDSGNCRVAQAVAEHTVGYGLVAVQETRLELKTFAARRCSIEVRVAEGSVISDPPGIACPAANSPCTAEFDLGSTVTLKPLNESQTMVPVWTAGCAGYGDCTVPVTASLSAAMQQEPRLCSADRTCYYNPIQGFIPTVVSHGASGDTWVAGVNSTMLFCSAGNCASLPTGVRQPITSISAGGPGEAWAFSQDGTAYFCQAGRCAATGQSLGTSPLGSSATATEGAWAVGTSGAVLHCQNNSCKTISAPTTVNLHGVSVDAQGAAWIAGDNRTVLRCQQNQCTLKYVSPGMNLKSVATTDTGNAWFAGDSGTVVYCTPTKCSTIVTGSTSGLAAVAAMPDGTAIAVGDGGTILSCTSAACRSIHASVARFSDVAVSQSGEAIVVGDGGSALRCAGTVCQPLSVSTTSNLLSVRMSPAGEAWIPSSAGTLVRCASGLCTSTTSGPITSTRSLSTTSSGAAWVAGDGGLLLSCTAARCSSVKNNGFDMKSVAATEQGTAWILSNGVVHACDLNGCRADPRWTQAVAVNAGIDGALWVTENMSGALALSYCNPASSCGITHYGELALLQPPIRGKDGSMTAPVRRNSQYGALTLPARPPLPPVNPDMGGTSFYVRSLSGPPVAVGPGFYNPSSPETWIITGDTSFSQLSLFCFKSPLTEVCNTSLGATPYKPIFSAVDIDLSGRAWAIGDMGTIVTCPVTGGCLFPTRPSLNRLTSVSVASNVLAWIVGDAGTGIRCAGAACTPWQLGTMQNMTKVDATSSSAVWAIGERGTVLRLGN